MKAHLGWSPPILGERVLCGITPTTLPKRIGDPRSLDDLCGNCKRIGMARPQWKALLDDLARRKQERGA